MSVTGLLIAIIGFIALALFIFAPLFERNRATNQSVVPLINPADELNTAYARIKSTLRDLDEDHALGKLDDSAYRTEREHWLTEGARVLAALDAIGEEKPA